MYANPGRLSMKFGAVVSRISDESLIGFLVVVNIFFVTLLLIILL